MQRSTIKERKLRRSQLSRLQTTTIANNKFSLDLYKLLNAANIKGSFVMSPISLQTALGIIYIGARGRTAEEMAAVLNLPADQDAVKIGIRQLLNFLKSSGSMRLEIANRIFISNSFNVLDHFRRTIKHAFKSDIEGLNFLTNHEKARKIINTWVGKRTKHKIKHIIGTRTLNAMSRLVVVNVVYFKGKWLRPFSNVDTEMGTFYISRNEEVDIPMMHNKTFFNFKYLDSLGASVLELPYEGVTVSMFILLPDDLEGIYDLERKLPAVDLTSTFKDMQPKELDIALPKFKIETSLSLKGCLMELGMKDMFLEENANFSGITDSPKLYVSVVLQRALLEVGELGTEAAAITAVVAEGHSQRPPAVEFAVDHPFLFIIWDKILNTSLFMGRYSGPG
jgi:serpin B